MQLFVPFDWRLLRFDWLWPGHWLFLILTLLGVVVLAVYWREATERPPELALRAKRLGLAALLLGLYLVVPRLGSGAAEHADNHFVHTLRIEGERVGKAVELHSAHFYPEGAHFYPEGAHFYPEGAHFYPEGERGPFVLDLATEVIELEGEIARDERLGRPARVSIRGRFVAEDRIFVEAYRIQPQGSRDLASYLGLAAVAAVWLVALSRRLRPRGTGAAR